VTPRHLAALGLLLGLSLVWVSVGPLETSSPFAAIAVLSTLGVFAYGLHRFGRGSARQSPVP
jgi:hypothetical protein